MSVTDQDGLTSYLEDGTRRAMALDNRGPIRFASDGGLHPDIVDAYDRCGFYVFTGVVDDRELAELRADIDDLLSRAPFPDRHSPTDRSGRPVAGAGLPSSPWHMAPPLSDPVGGTEHNNGRHPVKMHEPTPRYDASSGDGPDAPRPTEVPYMVSGGLALSETFLRVFGHPDLLRVAEAINGPDFTPFTEVLFVKEPGVGPSVAWHQDGQLHWDHPEWDRHIHGFNFQVQLYGSTAGNGVWVVPGSHAEGKIDIAALVEANGGSDRLPNAVPLICEPGDCFMTNRQTLHGSFPNTSDRRRITVNFGFHRYSSVIGQRGVLGGNGRYYDEDYVRERTRCIPIAVDARAGRFSDEERFVYRPFADVLDENRYDDTTRATVIKNSATNNLGI